MSDPVSAREFLSVIWGENQGVAELTYINDSTIPHGFTYPISLDAVITSVTNHNGQTNCYFGVCIRKPGTRIGYYDKKGHRGKETDSLSSTCVWADIDFKAVPEEEVRKLLKEFPLKPSIVVKSGGGVHVYWLLKEPATGDALAKVKAVNKALHGMLKCDKQTVDLARILRVPNTLNIKYTPPRQCEISWWKPELRYSLDDFDKILVVEEEKVATEAKAHEHHAPELPEEVRQKIEPLLKDLWIEGWRHRMALYIAGIFAHAGFSEATAKAVIQNVSNAADGDTDKRLRDVEDTYKNFKEKKAVGGAGLLEKMVREEFPSLVNGNAVKIYNEVLKHIKKAAPKGRRVNFAIDKIIKFDSRPARYRVILRMDGGDQINVDVDNTNLLTFKNFMSSAYEQTNQILAAKQASWEGLIGRVIPEVQPAPPEASPSGAFDLVLDEFVDDRKEISDNGILKAFPGYDEKEIFFKITALKATIRERGMKIDDNDIYQFLKARGWSSGTKRIGAKNKVDRVWKKPYENGTANLKPPPKELNHQMELPMPSIQPENSNDF